MLMRGEWCEVQQLLQIQGAVIRGGGRTPQKGLRGARMALAGGKGGISVPKAGFPTDACWFFLLESE